MNARIQNIDLGHEKGKSEEPTKCELKFHSELLEDDEEVECISDRMTNIGQLLIKFQRCKILV